MSNIPGEWSGGTCLCCLLSMPSRSCQVVYSASIRRLQLITPDTVLPAVTVLGQHCAHLPCVNSKPALPAEQQNEGAGDNARLYCTADYK